MQDETSRQIAAAYLAGLIDGDGCVLIRRRDRSATPGDRQRGISFAVLVKIGGEPEHLRALAAEWNVGTIYVRKLPGQRHLAEWTIAGGNAVDVLVAVAPFLRLKREQAREALAMPRPRSRWGATPEVRHLQELARVRVSELNRAGRGKVVEYGN